MARPYSLSATPNGDGWTICVCSKRNGRLLPITNGTFVPKSAMAQPKPFFEAARTELAKAGQATSAEGKYLRTPATSGEGGDI